MFALLLVFSCVFQPNGDFLMIFYLSIIERGNKNNANIGVGASIWAEYGIGSVEYGKSNRKTRLLGGFFFFSILPSAL